MHDFTKVCAYFRSGQIQTYNTNNKFRLLYLPSGFSPLYLGGFSTESTIVTYNLFPPSYITLGYTIGNIRPTCCPDIYHRYHLGAPPSLIESFVLDSNDASATTFLGDFFIEHDKTEYLWIFAWCHKRLFNKRAHWYHR